ncbi:uncharacterized protein LOC113497022 [Trichoplusia ni]|uniref:Uncharacterized protein LOC113497022 n=1 Tax=Trichoplusia ni TaxID=7111 RepID=A0A7E5VV90_TRINI|nr:uncharacterized protein LOC113497022 [Trichoplusia ni]
MFWLSLFLVAIVGSVHAQQTAQTRVADELSECYRDPNLLNRNNLPPVTIQVLIDIIRKIEDNPNVNMDLRQLSAVLLHTYRQDGIEFHQPENSMSSSNVLPFAPTFHSFHRHRLLLTRLIPNNLQVLGNDTVSSVLKCTLHHMLSTTVDARVRGDETQCNQLSQYRSLRTARSARSISEDVEIMKPSALKSANRRNGHMRHFDPNNDVEFSNFGGSLSERQVVESTCPLLDGVVNTPWGAVSAGNLIAGIAAGAQPQQVNIYELVRDSTLNYRSVQQTVNSLFPATLSGDLAEAVLIQGTERGSTSISIGTAGNWNSTQATRHFMLQNRVNVEMTDPEIRGDIDGFVLGRSMTSLLGAFSSMKVSQLLDMYYSPRNGAFDPNLRACNRRQLLPQFATSENLISETLAFTAALDTNMPLRGTIVDGMEQLVTSAVTNLMTYTTNNMNDMNCATTVTQSNDFRLNTNLYIALDASWPYTAVFPAISYLIDTIEIGKFGSSITLLSAFDGSVVINTTHSPADFYAEYTLSKHQQILNGVNLETSLNNIRLRMQDQLRNESLAGYVGGNSTVLLYLINSGNLQNNVAIQEHARLLNDTVPDLRLLFASATNQYDNLWSLVRDMYNDIFTINLNQAGTNVATAMQPVLQRIQSVGRRIVNPICGSAFAEGTSGTRQFIDAVEPGYINFYALSANYFYVSDNVNRKIRISRVGAGSGSLIICSSRTNPQPRTNTTSNPDASATSCQTLGASGNVEITLVDACADYSMIGSCPPLYLSIQSNAELTPGSFASAVCTDISCRFPYNIRYQVQIEDLGCWSGAGSVTASFIFILASLYFTLNGSW